MNHRGTSEMKHFVTVFGIGLCMALSAQDPQLSAVAEKQDARYKINEEIVFRVELKDKDGKALSGREVTCEITGDGGLKQESKIISSGQPLEIKTSLNRPGFVLLKAALKENPKINMDAGAAVEPEKITPSTPEPPDFDAFWKKQIDTLMSRTEKMKISIHEIALSPEWKGKCRMYDIRLEDGVLNATGTLAVPEVPPGTKLPIIMMFNGASGIGSGSPDSLSQAVNYKALVFHMNLHDTANIVKKEEIADFRKLPSIYQYQYRDADNPEKYGMKDIFLRVIRCKEYLKTRPEWDGKTILVRGGSLGGAQAIVAAAFDPQVVLCVAGAPAMCNHLGNPAGWPRLLEMSRYRTDKAKQEAARKVLPYYDIANFARRVRCEAILSVGFIDTACCPSSVYAAYNVIPSAKKEMNEVPRGNHGTNLDRSQGAKPGVFGYGGRRVAEVAGEAFRNANTKRP